MRNIISYFPDDTLRDVTSLFRRQKNISVSGAGNASSKAMILNQVLKKNRDILSYPAIFDPITDKGFEGGFHSRRSGVGFLTLRI